MTVKTYSIDAYWRMDSDPKMNEDINGDYVLHSDYLTLERERDELKRRLDKLKNLVLLTDQSLACLEMQSMNITIWGEYCKAYPDECEIASLGVTP